MKKILAFLAAMVAVTPAVPAEAFTYEEEWLYTANEELIVRTVTSQLSVKSTGEIWFIPEFYAYSPGAFTERVYPHFNGSKNNIELKKEESEDVVIIFDCKTAKNRYTYSADMLLGGTLYDVKNDMCTRYYGAEWEYEAEFNDTREEEKEHAEREYSLRLRYTSIGYMDIKIHPKDFRYDPEKGVVYVPWIAHHKEGEVRYTVDGSSDNRTFYREDTFGRFLATPTGKYAIDCKDTFMGRLTRHMGTPYRVEDPHTRELKRDKLHHFTQNAICKYKHEYREVYKAS